MARRYNRTASQLHPKHNACVVFFLLNLQGSGGPEKPCRSMVPGGFSSIAERNRLPAYWSIVPLVRRLLKQSPLVEADGFEPTTYGLQSRRSPS